MYIYGVSSRLAKVPLQPLPAAQEAPASNSAVMFSKRFVSPGPRGNSAELWGYT